MNSYQPSMNLCSKNGVKWFKGKFSFKSSLRNDTFIDEYYLTIEIPKDYPKTFPIVKEYKNKIKGFHKNPDNSLCLATPTETFLRYYEKPCLANFIENLLIPYLFSHQFFLKFNRLPYGEREHGALGLIEFYNEFFNIKDIELVIQFLSYCINKTYKDQDYCICGSNKMLRNCHKEQVLKLKSVPREYLESEYLEILFFFYSTY